MCLILRVLLRDPEYDGHKMIKFPKIETFEQHGGGVFVPNKESEQKEYTEPEENKIITKKESKKLKTKETKKGSHCMLYY